MAETPDDPGKLEETATMLRATIDALSLEGCKSKRRYPARRTTHPAHRTGSWVFD